MHRSFLINVASYAIKAAYPILLFLAIHLYGAERFGLFTFAQAVLLFSARGCLLGLEKGLLWWIPQLPEAREREGLAAVFRVVTLMSLGVALVLALVGAPWIAHWADKPEAVSYLRWMVAGLVPLTLMELLVHAAVAKRRIAAQAIVREGFVSSLQVGVAVCFYYLGFHDSGLAWAFFIAQVMGLALSFLLFRRAFCASTWRDSAGELPPVLLRYAVPMGLANMATSLRYQMDVYILAIYSDPWSVGIYTAMLQLVQNISAVRRSYEGIVLAVIAQISITRDLIRLRESFSHATVLMIQILAPLCAALVVFSPWILAKLGEGFTHVFYPGVILGSFLAVESIVGMHGNIVTGMGRSDLNLRNILISLAVGGVCLFWMVPHFGLYGAAIGMGISHLMLTILQTVEARLITGTWHYNKKIAMTLLQTLVASAAMVVMWELLTPLGDNIQRIGAFVSFAAVFLIIFLGQFGQPSSYCK